MKTKNTYHPQSLCLRIDGKIEPGFGSAGDAMCCFKEK